MLSSEGAAGASPLPARGMHAALKREAVALSNWCCGISTKHLRKGITEDDVEGDFMF